MYLSAGKSEGVIVVEKRTNVRGAKDPDHIHAESERGRTACRIL